MAAAGSVTDGHEMSDETIRIGRRTLFAGLAAVTVGAGCAHLPRSIEAKRAHPCDARHCRYWRASGGEGELGTCMLALRAEGGH
jgi:uncharacterized protein (DUF39 family)